MNVLTPWNRKVPGGSYDFEGKYANGGIPGGYQSVLHKDQWIGVQKFVKAVDGKLLVSVNNCPGLRSAVQQERFSNFQLHSKSRKVSKNDFRNNQISRDKTPKPEKPLRQQGKMGFVAKDETLSRSIPKDEPPSRRFVVKFRHSGQHMGIRFSSFSMP